MAQMLYSSKVFFIFEYKQQKPMKKSFLIFLLIIICYLVWVSLGKTYNSPQHLEVNNFESFGDSSNRANIVGFQTFMEAGDYATEQRFRQKIEAYFQQAQQKNWLIQNKTIVVLPEYIGTWLVVMNEKSGIYEAKTMQSGLTTMVLSHVFDFLKNYLAAPSIDDKVKHAVFAMKAHEMADTYQKVFAQLAQKYKVTVVAGSILLPEPSVKNGKLEISTNGMLYNTSAVFYPNGKIDENLIKKAFPVSDEKPFVCAENTQNIPVFETPTGKLGVLICADAWYAAAYKTLKQKSAEMIVVPSYSTGNGLWKQKWNGYSGFDSPEESKADIGKITLGEAWQKYAMGMRAYYEANIKKGLNVFLQGTLWDLGTDGTTIILDDSTSKTTKHFGGSAIVNLWL